MQVIIKRHTPRSHMAVGFLNLDPGGRGSAQKIVEALNFDELWESEGKGAFSKPLPSLGSYDCCDTPTPFGPLPNYRIMLRCPDWSFLSSSRTELTHLLRGLHIQWLLIQNETLDEVQPVAYYDIQFHDVGPVRQLYKDLDANIVWWP